MKSTGTLKLLIACTVLGLTTLAPARAQAQSTAAPQYLDYMEEMRLFIQATSAFARRFNPKFMVLAEDGAELLIKTDPDDETLQFPARGYIQAIDGVLEHDALAPRIAGEKSTKRYERYLSSLTRAKSFGLAVLNMEFATERDRINLALTESRKLGLTPFVALNRDLMALPRYPATPFNINPNHIMTLGAAGNFLYIADSSAFGPVKDYLATLRNTNYDVIIIDVFHDGVPLTRDQVERLKFKGIGSRRIVLAQVDIASAAKNNFYWKPGWRQGSPKFLVEPLPFDPDRHRVEYWRPEWKSLMYGTQDSYIYGVIDLGFDGVLLKDADAWVYFETGEDAPRP